MSTTKPIIIAHRGASGYAPENTIAAFAKALELGVDMIELDVHRCATGELVVIHDREVDRTTNGTGYVAHMSLQELQKLDAGNGECIPTLEQVVNFINRRCIINVELKGLHTALPTIKLINEYVNVRGWAYEDFLVSSFNHRQLIIVHRANKEIRIGVLLRCIPVTYGAIGQRLEAFSMHVAAQEIEVDFVKDIHRRGMQCYVYTVNNVADAKRLIALKVDGIFTDYPDRMSL